MNKQDEVANRFATIVDAEVNKYEKEKGKKASDYIRRKFRDKALAIMVAKYPTEVQQVREFVSFLNTATKKAGHPSYPSWEQTPMEVRPGAEIYNIYRGILSSKTRYRNGGMDAYRGPKNKTIIQRGEQPMAVATTQHAEYNSDAAKKEFFRVMESGVPWGNSLDAIAVLLKADQDTLRLWGNEWNRNHRLSKLISALSPEDMEALTDLLSQK